MIRPHDEADPQDRPGLAPPGAVADWPPAFLGRDPRRGERCGLWLPDGAGGFRSLPDPDPARVRAILAAEPTRPVVLATRLHSAEWAAEAGLAAERCWALDELAAWFDPGGLGADGEQLARAGEPSAERLSDLDGPGLQRALVATLVRALALPAAALGARARALEAAAAATREDEPRTARRLLLLHAWLEHPSAVGAPRRLDGALSAAAQDCPELELAAGAAPLGCEGNGADGALAPLPVDRDDVGPLSAEDCARIAQLFAAPGARGLEERPAQAAVAAAVAATLGRRELLLAHAPTGTGKTLAYLVPALLFALRNGVRLGVATYSRALQAQAFHRDLPLALELLRRAGVQELPRAALLKGRQNYLCGRSLAAVGVRPEDGAGAALAYAHLLAFALGSPDGDLDRLPPLEQTPCGEVAEAGAEFQRLLRAVRGRTGCCRRRADRERCGAELARERAERSHLVVTNHAFVLARREFFRHLVFDECEHLHDQAHSAYSHVVSTAALEDQLEALRGTGRRGRGPLERLLRTAALGSVAQTQADLAAQAQQRALDATAALEGAARRFLDWREAQLAEREEREAHSLLREYVAQDRDPELRTHHAALCAALDRLDAALSAVCEALDEVADGGGRRLRAPLEQARSELAESSAAVRAWLPTVDGRPDYRPETFYDLEPAPRGRGLSLHARVLLPNEFLGRYLLPDLSSAVLLSATTWLGGGFEAASGYLGLDRAAEPAPDEARAPSVVRTLRAPESFDYGRVLVGVPRDAPDYRAGKAAWLEYTARFLVHLGLRTRGRTLVLCTNAADAVELGRRSAAPLSAAGIECLTQGLSPGSTEQLAASFRSAAQAVLIGLDSFWFGADFPGAALEYVVLPKLPYGVPDRYHYAQCAVLGTAAQRKRIYMPRSLARFRQGFGRLMRRASDRGCVFLLDQRVLEPRHRTFLRELPLAEEEGGAGARLLRGETERVLGAAFEHMGLAAELRERGLDGPFAGPRGEAGCAGSGSELPGELN
jgi:ATP-dependent DNA helicase DinG